MCQVLHSHNDEVRIRILKAQLPAMSADSAPLIDDKDISDEQGSGAPSVLPATEFSLTMFKMFKGVARLGGGNCLMMRVIELILCKGIRKIMVVLSLTLRSEGIGRFSMLKSFASLCNGEG
jgi:hypothetical protein